MLKKGNSIVNQTMGGIKMAVDLLLGFDVERPYGDFAKGDEGKEQVKRNLNVIEEINDLCEKVGAGRTFFI